MLNEELGSGRSVSMNLENRLGQLANRLSNVESAHRLDSSVGFMEKLQILDEKLRNSQ